MYKLNKFLIQKKYNKIEKELIINNYKEGVKIDNKYKSLYNFINNKLNGEYIQWYENGQLNLKCYYKNYKRNGEYREWYKNGQSRIKYYCKNYKLTSEYRAWYENGQLSEKWYYKNGKINSEYLR